jgi:phospholipase/carboxylesterase
MTSGASAPPLDGPRLGPLSGRPATGLVVLLHGYGSNGDDMIQFAGQIQPSLPDVAFIAPHGHLTLGSSSRRAWIDLTPPLDPQQIWRGAVAARPVLDRFLDVERDRLGIEDQRIVLVGFSQGTFMALHVGPRRERAVGAIVGYSGLLSGPEHLDEITARPPVTLVHGDLDQVVSLKEMHAGAAALERAGVPVTTYVATGIGHSIDTRGMLVGIEAIQAAVSAR